MMKIDAPPARPHKLHKRYLLAGGLLVIVVVFGGVYLLIRFTQGSPKVTQPAALHQSSSTRNSPPASAIPQTVEQAFPDAEELRLGESHSDGALSYKLLSVQPNYSDAKYSDELASLNPYSNRGIPGADTETQTFKLVTIQFTNTSGRTACENVLTTCPDGGPKFDFGCIFTSDGSAAKLSPGATNGLENTAENDFVFHPHLIEPTTYPNTSLLDKGSVLSGGGTYTLEIEISSDCTAVGNATGTVYWTI